MWPVTVNRLSEPDFSSRTFVSGCEVRARKIERPQTGRK